MSDNELDNLFKEAADGFNTPHDPTAWKQMAKKLDDAGNTVGFWNWKIISMLTVVGIMTGLIWYLSVSNSTGPSKAAEVKADKLVEEVKPETGQSAIANAERDQADLQSESRHDHDDQINEHALAKTDVQTSQSQATNSKKEVQTTVPPKAENNTNSTAGISKTTSPNKEINPETSNGKLKGEESSEGLVTAALVSGIQQSNANTSGNPSTPLNTGNESVTIQKKSMVEPDSLIKKEEVKKNMLNTDSASLKEVVVKTSDEKRPVNRFISVRAIAGVDLSSIKFFTLDDPGFNYGLLLGYAFNDRWSLYSGAVSSRKIYTSYDIDEAYTNASGYDYPINQLDGDCRVLDIPINIYYTFFPTRSFSIRAGMGFSSYIMLSEDYVYHVDNPYGSDVYYQSVSRENNEWFKILNASVVLQKRLNDKFSLELEPYLKAPLAGVGEGEVSLVSLGAFFNVRYDIPLQKK